MKTVSFIVPTYNREKIIHRTIKSILAQTGINVELIVVDDGSTDNTKMALKPYEDKIKYCWQENQGAPVARNLGKAMASGEYIRFVDSDDVILPPSSQQLIALLEKDKTDIAYGDWQHANVAENDSDNLMPLAYVAAEAHPDILKKMLSGWWVANFAYLYRSNVAKAVDWRRDLNRSQDYEYAIKCCLNGAKYSYYNDLVGYYVSQTSERISDVGNLLGGKAKILILDEVVTIMQKAGTLNEARKNAVAENYWGISRLLLKGDLTAYLHCIQQLKLMAPGWQPSALGLRAKLTRVFGIYATDLILKLFFSLKIFRR